MQSFLVQKLIELTKKDEIVWKDISVPGFTNNFIENRITGNYFRTEWLQDGNPQLFVDQILIVKGKEVGELIQAIKQQQERLGLGVYSRSETDRVKQRKLLLQTEEAALEGRRRAIEAKVLLDLDSLEYP